jgi:hypothetical protein
MGKKTKEPDMCSRSLDATKSLLHCITNHFNIVVVQAYKSASLYYIGVELFGTHFVLYV